MANCHLARHHPHTMSGDPQSDVVSIEKIPIDIDNPTKGVIAKVVICRPDKLNALNSEVHEAIKNACEWASNNDDVRVVVFTGSEPNPPPEGKRAKPHSFVAGADISEFVGKTSEVIRVEFANSSWDAVWNLEIPTIAIIDGFALGGGCELALSCDMRIASNRSKLGQPEINLGIIPGAGGTQRLSRLVGYGKTMELVLSGEMISAEEGLQIGLLNSICEPDEVMEHGIRLARKIGGKSPLTLREAKRAVRASLELPLSEGINFEAEIFASLFDTENKEIGVSAFLDRSNPEWVGR